MGARWHGSVGSKSEEASHFLEKAYTQVRRPPAASQVAPMPEESWLAWVVRRPSRGTRWSSGAAGGCARGAETIFPGPLRRLDFGRQSSSTHPATPWRRMTQRKRITRPASRRGCRDSGIDPAKVAVSCCVAGWRTCHSGECNHYVFNCLRRSSESAKLADSAGGRGGLP
jgi:hypothetical protein